MFIQNEDSAIEAAADGRSTISSSATDPKDGTSSPSGDGIVTKHIRQLRKMALQHSKWAEKMLEQ